MRYASANERFVLRGGDYSGFRGLADASGYESSVECPGIGLKCCVGGDWIGNPTRERGTVVWASLTGLLIFWAVGLAVFELLLDCAKGV